MNQPSNKDPFAAPGFTPPPVHKPGAPPKAPAQSGPLPAPHPPPLKKKEQPPGDPTLVLPPKPALPKNAGFVFSVDTPQPARALGPRLSPAHALADAPTLPPAGERSYHSIASQDLTGEKLLMPAARTQFENACAPSLGGIPLLAKLGQGGMGAVYLGVDPQSNQEVAVKVLPFHMAERDPALIERFFREAKMSMSVSSPNLVRVTHAKEENGLCYLVMEFVPGTSGGGYMKKNKGARLTEADALDICIAATKGLSAAHKAGIIHRDIKPDNILLPQGSAPGQFNLSASKLADLGLARTEEHGNSLTQSQTAMGTPGYLAPEQAMDARKCGKPADVFSMGATLYAMLTGRPPFHAKSPMEVIMATMNKPHDPLPSLRPDVSASTVALVDRCLRKEAQHRFRDADALLTALQLCRDVLAHPERQSQAIEQIRGNQPAHADAPKAEQPYFNELTMQAPAPLRRTDVEAEAGIAKLRADDGRRTMMPTVAAVILAGFLVAGVMMIVMAPPAPERKVEATEPELQPEKVLPKPVQPPPSAPEPTGPQSLGDKKFQDLQQQQLDRLNNVANSLDKANEKVKQAKIVEPIMPISSVQDEAPGETFFSAGRVMFSFIVSIVGMAYMLYSRKSKGLTFGLCGAGLAMIGWFIPWLSVGVMVAGVLITLPLFLAKR